MYDFCFEHFDEDFVAQKDRSLNEVHGSENATGSNEIPMDPVPISSSSTTSSIDFYHRVYAWLPSYSSICNIETPKMVFPKPLMMVKGCPRITIKGKPRDPLDFFDNTDFVLHAYRTRNNPQPTVPATLPPTQPVLPQAPRLPSSFKEYDLVEQLRATPAKISLWELLQTSPTYHEALQKALSTLPKLRLPTKRILIHF